MSQNDDEKYKKARDKLFPSAISSQKILMI